MALVDSIQCLASYKDEDSQSHARKITIEIEKIVEKAEVKKTELTAVAINQGPGSFTGLRVGSSVAKGICYALQIPLIALDGLSEYGRFFYQKNNDKYTDIFVLEDARRGNYFYSHISKGEIKIKSAFAHITDIETEVYLSRSPALLYTDKAEVVEAQYLADAAREKFRIKSFENMAEFEPLYMLNNYQKQR